MHRESATVFRYTRPRRSNQIFGFFGLAHGGASGRACRESHKSTQASRQTKNETIALQELGA